MILCMKIIQRDLILLELKIKFTMEQVNLIDFLLEKNMEHIVKIMFRNLSGKDLHSVRCVKRSWRDLSEWLVVFMSIMIILSKEHGKIVMGNMLFKIYEKSFLRKVF